MEGSDTISSSLKSMPKGAWIAIVAGGVGIYWYTQRRSSNAAPVPPTTLADAVGAGPTAYTAVVPTPAPTSNAPSYTTNDGWAVAAITWAIGHGYDPVMADAAVRDYINGQDFPNPQYQAIISAVLAAIGPPPQPLTPYNNNPTNVVTPPVVPAPAPAPTPAPAPPPPPPPPPAPPAAPRTYTVQPWPALGSTLWGIAVIEYGNGGRWPDILNANPGKVPYNNPRLLQPGTVLVIP